jgi:hypothetical protein
MSELKFALLAVALAGCGQAAPDMDSAFTASAQQALVEMGQHRAQAAAAEAPRELSASVSASTEKTPSIRCGASRMRRNSKIDSTPLPAPDPEYRTPSPPPLEVLEPSADNPSKASGTVQAATPGAASAEAEKQ